MEIKLQKWGNSQGIRIPNTVLKSLNINNNDTLLLEQVEDKIVISVSKKRKINLKKLFEEYKGDNESRTFEWDQPRGKEIW